MGKACSARAFEQAKAEDANAVIASAAIEAELIGMDPDFIRVETIAYHYYVSLGGENTAREAGKLRQECK